MHKFVRGVVRLGISMLVGTGTLTTMPASAQTVLLTDASSITSPTVIDFNSGASQSGSAPIQIGAPVGRNVTWQCGDGLVFFNGNDAIGENGRWDAGKTPYALINSFTDSATIRFLDGPVSAVGAFVNYAVVPSLGVGDDATIEVLGAGDAVLGSYNLATVAPISTPGGVNAGAFRGIARPTADILAFRIKNDAMVLDDLRFTSVTASPVPEPNSLLLFLPVLVVFGLLKRHRA